MFKDFVKLVQSLNKKNQIIFFCESESMYHKIFENKIKFFEKKNYRILIITFKSELKEKYTNQLIDYVNFNNFDLLKVFFKKVKNKIIISSTPTINKTISNKSNYFIFIQHTLLRLSNKFSLDHIKNFDLVTVSSEDQIHECTNSLGIESKKILYNKYHNLDFLLENKFEYNDNLGKENILLASSFYGNHLIKLINEDFINKLLEYYNIILRPHPELFKNNAMTYKINTLEKKYNNSNFKISREISNKNIIDQSAYLITDFSGIGLSFSYRKLLPTIFIINQFEDEELLNENYYETTLNKIGIVTNFNIEDLLKIVREINTNKNKYKNDIKEYRDLQFKKFDNKNNLENFILKKLTKIF